MKVEVNAMFKTLVKMCEDFRFNAGKELTPKPRLNLACLEASLRDFVDNDRYGGYEKDRIANMLRNADKMLADVADICEFEYPEG